jgi:hypothetical protein
MRLLSVTVILLLGLAVAAIGQDRNQDFGPRDAFFMGGMGGWGHASTAAEGAMRGMGDLTRSVGAANLMNSEAAKNMEDARQSYIQNRAYATETYFGMRDMNKQARAAEQGPRPTQEDAARYASARMPQRLSLSELDPLSGAIAWPAQLNDPVYQEPKQQLEQLFAARAQNGYLTVQERALLEQSTDQLLATLKSNIDVYTPMDYVAAKKFVDGLSFELRSSPS